MFYGKLVCRIYQPLCFSIQFDFFLSSNKQVIFFTTKFIIYPKFITFLLLVSHEFSACLGGNQSAVLWKDCFVEHTTIIMSILCWFLHLTSKWARKTKGNDQKELLALRKGISAFLVFKKMMKNVMCQQGLATVGSTWGNMTNLYDHWRQHHKTMYDQCKAKIKFYPRHLSILYAYACAALHEKGSKCHIESTRILNNWPGFSKFTPVVVCVINSFQIELQEFSAAEIMPLLFL